MRRIVIVFLVLGCGLTALSPFQTRPGTEQAEQFFATGERLYAEGKYKLAADTLAVSAALFGKAEKTTEQIRSANLQAECLSNLGQCETAGLLLQHSLDVITKEQPGNKKLLAETYYYLSRHAGGCARKFDESIALMQRSLELKTSLYSKDDPELAFDYTFLGYVYNSKGKYDSALMYLDKAITIRKQQLAPGDVETSHTLFNLAASYEGKSDLGKALELNLEALQIRTEKLGPSHVTVSNSINSIGRIYRKLGNNERALEYYRQALEVRKNTLGANHPNVAASYYEIGNLYGNIANYHSALEFIQEGNRILESNTQVANDVLPTYLAYAGKMYGLLGDHSNARAMIQKGINVAEKKLPPTHPYRAIVYNVAGEYYGEIGDTKNQSDFFKKAIAIYQQSYGPGSEREADVIAKMAATRARLGNPEETLKLYNEALAMYVSKLGDQNPKVASIHLGLGDVYAAMVNFPSSEKEYQQAAESIAGVDNKPLLLKIARNKAQMLHRLSTTLSPPIAKQRRRAALASFHDALQLTDEIAQGYASEAARVQLERERREMSSAAMKVAWELYNASPEQAILDEAFLMAERSKAAILLENTRDQQAKTMAGVPDSLVDKERDIRIELAYYKTNLYQSQKNQDTTAVKSFEKNIFDSERKLESFTSQLEHNFPAYYQLKYNKAAAGVADLQGKIADNTTLLQYFVGDDALYCFVISKNGAELKRQAIDTVFEETVAGYQKSLTDFSFIMNHQASADSLYQATARLLFTLLMLPSQPGKLIIVPDDFLAQLNFGTLLYDDIVGKNYTTLPYLGSKFTVSYAYSSAYLTKDARSTKSTRNNFAGFAPSYDQLDYTSVDSAAHPMTMLVMRSGNLPLPGARDEVNLISNLMQGQSWIAEEATETNFKKYGGDYGVLHLAMHSLLNDEEPRYSELLFNHHQDQENDGFLTIAEIYNLKLNAQLVVLSACSSGFGKIQHGEGPISLSRAFSYAGCSSVVMSLWKVPDLVTTNIMKNFYESLADGLPKDEALQSAQMKFLKENTDPIYSHPYYWAGFVVIGDTQPLDTRSYTFLYIVGALAVALAVGFLMIRRAKRDRNVQ